MVNKKYHLSLGVLSLSKHQIRFFLVGIGAVWCYDLDVLHKGL